MKHIVVAVEPSKAGRAAALTGLRWGARVGARVTILATTEPAAVARGGLASVPSNGLSAADVELWLQPELAREPSWPRPAVAQAVGVPSVEIARFAENAGAGLLVLGRDRRGANGSADLAEVPDAVARRSHVPCLFAPAPLGVPGRFLAAVETTARGYWMYTAARRIATALGAELEVLTVEPAAEEGPLGDVQLVPATATMKFHSLLREAGAELRIRRGPVVQEILAEAEAIRAQALVIGYPRGGPPRVVGTGSVGHDLTRLAPCAVLTVPL